MTDLQEVERLAVRYYIPFEDALFISLNLRGVAFSCDFNRMRMRLRLAEKPMFKRALAQGAREYYFALPVMENSPFSIQEGVLFFNGEALGIVTDPSEDFCDSHYPRRAGTVLNLNPNSRTSCRGCKFCYTGYQIPRDRERIGCRKELRRFFEEWMQQRGQADLSHLIQIAVVTGCYQTDEDLLDFLLLLRNVVSELRFTGEIFYLGSQITKMEVLEALRAIQPFCYCVSLECFERRDELLRDKKSRLSLDQARDLMKHAKSIGLGVNFSYIVGLEDMAMMERQFASFPGIVTRFPIINTLQIHKHHCEEMLRDPRARNLDYFLEARRLIEGTFAPFGMQPRVWENYRSLWYLEYAGQPLSGIRTP